MDQIKEAIANRSFLPSDVSPIISYVILNSGQYIIHRFLQYAQILITISQKGLKNLSSFTSQNLVVML